MPVWPSLLAVLITAAGCANTSAMKFKSDRGRVELTSYAQPDRPETYFQDFALAWFSSQPNGDIEILLETSQPIESLGYDVLQQSLYIHVLWTPIPGKTYAESTQINAQITYEMRVANTGQRVRSASDDQPICYKGSGFVTFTTDWRGNGLTGKIERAGLEPQKSAPDLALGRLVLKGAFNAIRSAEAINEYKITGGNLSR